MVHQAQGGEGHAVLVPGQVLADGRGAVHAARAAVGAGLDGAADDAVGGEEAEDAVHHGGGLRVRGGQLGRNVGGAEPGAGAGADDDLQELELDGGLEGHGEDGAAHQLRRVHARLLVLLRAQLQRRRRRRLLHGSHCSRWELQGVR